MMKRAKPDLFTRFTSAASIMLGRPWIFVMALCVLGVWFISGPLLHFSDTWQLIINTSTTIITFLMVFVIQNTQNRDNMAMNIKLDAIMKKVGVTREDLLGAEDQSDMVLEKEKREMERTKHRRGTKQKASQHTK